MAPSSGVRRRTETVRWSLRNVYSMPRCNVTRAIIWPWQQAWRKRTSYGWDYKIHTTYDVWITEHTYLLMKLKDKLDNV